MTGLPLTALGRLARGQRVDAEVFRSLLEDMATVTELARLLQVRELLDPAEPEVLEPTNLPEMDVSLEEVTRYLEGRSLEPGRSWRVERFLTRHYPEALRDSTDTRIEFPSAQNATLEVPSEEDTRIEPRPGGLPVPPWLEPPSDPTRSH